MRPLVACRTAPVAGTGVTRPDAPIVERAAARVQSTMTI